MLSLAALAVAGVFHNNHFVLLLMVTVLLYSVATLGLNVQFGYAGVVNFAGASFFGIGAYTSAVLNAQANIPPLVVIVIGGLLAALVGSLLLLPVLRTRGHYAAVVTIAFALLFKTFLEVNDVLGGPQGMQVKPMTLFGWSFNDGIEIGGVSASFYLNYFLLSLFCWAAPSFWCSAWNARGSGSISTRCGSTKPPPAASGSTSPAGRLPRFSSATSSSASAGALFGMVGGFVAPNNYTFANSLILVSILLLGGIGNPWGLVVATIVVVVVPRSCRRCRNTVSCSMR